MKRALTVAAVLGLATLAFGSSGCSEAMAEQIQPMTKSGTCNLHGKVKIVSAFPKYKIKIVNAFPDIKVKKVTAFPDKAGEWQFVDAFPDFTVQIVDAFPDFTVQYVDAFPGC